MRFRPSRLILPAILFASALSISAYVIRKGDTLWDISDKHLSSPFNWVAIWQLNPHIANPDSIEPGQKIKLPGSGLIKSDKEIEEELGIKIQGNRGSLEALRARFQQGLGPLAGRKTNVKSFDYKTPPHRQEEKSEALMADALIWSAPTLVQPVGEYRIFAEQWHLYQDSRSNRQGQLLRPGQNYKISQKEGGNVRKGEILELFSERLSRYRMISGKDSVSVAAYAPLGIAEVQKISGDSALVQVLATYETEDPKYLRARKAPPRPPVRVASYQRVGGMEVQSGAQIIHVFNPNAYAQTMNWVLINKGTEDGYEPGDAVALWEGGLDPEKNLPPALIGEGVIVQSNSLGSAVFLRKLNTEHFSPMRHDLVTVTAKARLK
jgi:hypothetical protein